MQVTITAGEISALQVGFDIRDSGDALEFSGSLVLPVTFEDSEGSEVTCQPDQPYVGRFGARADVLPSEWVANGTLTAFGNGRYYDGCGPNGILWDLNGAAQANITLLGLTGDLSVNASLLVRLACTSCTPFPSPLPLSPVPRRSCSYRSGVRAGCS